ncbi:hypothetical protein FRB95_013481, partial [Tulasnella sp. JGI-2019a]
MYILVTKTGSKPSEPSAQDLDVVMNGSSTTAPRDDIMGTSGTRDNLNTEMTSNHNDAGGAPMEVDPCQTSQTAGAGDQYGTGADSPDAMPALLPADLERISMTGKAMDIEDDRISYVSNDRLPSVSDDSISSMSDDELMTTPTTSSDTAPAFPMDQSKSSHHAALSLSMFVTNQPYGLSPYPDMPESAPANDDITSSSSQPIKLDIDLTQTISVTPPSNSVDVKTDIGAPMYLDQGQIQQSENHGGEDHRQDLLPKVKGLFRLLDLYSEQGSGGLVDKIIIAQDSLKSLIDTLSP